MTTGILRHGWQPHTVHRYVKVTFGDFLDYSEKIRRFLAKWIFDGKLTSTPGNVPSKNKLVPFLVPHAKQKNSFRFLIIFKIES